MQSQPSARRTASGNVRRVERKRGDQWYIQYRLPDGRQGQKRLGPAWSGNGRPPAGYFTKRTAQTALRQFLTDADRGVLPEAAQRTGATVGDAVEEWLRYVEHERGVRATTLREYRTATRKHLVPAFGDRRLEAVTTRSIETWKSQLLADGKLSRRTINKLLTNLHGVFERARRVWGLERNPVADVERLRERYDAGDYDWLRPEEVYALVRAAEEAPIEKRVAEQDAAIFLTAAFVGLRLGEVLGLRWRDVDFTGSVLRVTQQWNDLGEVSATKGGRVRAVPMVPKVAERLARLSQRGFFTTEDDPVFVGIERWRREVEEEGEPHEVEAITEFVDRSGLRRRYKAALKRAELRPIRFHDLRHTMGTLASNHASARELQEWLGHADVRTTQRYTHYRARPDEAQRLAQAFEPATELERAVQDAVEAAD